MVPIYTLHEITFASNNCFVSRALAASQRSHITAMASECWLLAYEPNGDYECRYAPAAGRYYNDNLCYFLSLERRMSLNVSLPTEMENRVREHVASGMYGSASEVIREALRLFEAYQATRESSFSKLKADIAQGLSDIETGRVGDLDMESIKRQGREALAARNTAK
jgi:antitoxin ParD1/3/4